MRRNGLFIIVPLVLLSGYANAQMSLSDQINAVSAAQDQEQRRQDAMAHAEAVQAARAAAAQRAAQAAVERQRAAAVQMQHDEAMADKKRDQSYEDQLRDLQIEHAKLQLLNEQQKVTTDKARDQAYEDKLRDMDLQAKALQLKQLETRVSRENDVIDHNLKREDAQTDVIQSGADANRNVSQGVEGFLKNAHTDISTRSTSFVGTTVVGK
jgi:flagellar biosynthesis GTPase FlhF